jgi:hypothetical protein
MRVRVAASRTPASNKTAVPLLRDQLDGLALIDLREVLPGGADRCLDLGHRLLGFFFAAVGHQPARDFGQHPPDEDDHDGQQRGHQEAQPPAHVDREVIQEDVGHERAEDRPGRVWCTGIRDQGGCTNHAL